MRLALKLVIHLLVLRHLMKQDIELQEDCQPVPRLRLIRQAILNNLAEQFILSQEYQSSLLTIAGVDNVLDLDNGFGVVLHDVTERATRDPHFSASSDHSHASVHVLDDL